MAKLNFKDEFTLEVGDDVYTGTLLDLDKKQKKDVNKIGEKAKAKNDELNSQYKRVARLQKNININENLNDWATVKTLQAELETLQDSAEALERELEADTSIERMFKRRMELTLVSDDKAEILAAGERYGYQNVYSTILQDIKETRAKK